MPGTSAHEEQAQVLDHLVDVDLDVLGDLADVHALVPVDVAHDLEQPRQVLRRRRGGAPGAPRGAVPVDLGSSQALLELSRPAQAAQHAGAHAGLQPRLGLARLQQGLQRVCGAELGVQRVGLRQVRELRRRHEGVRAHGGDLVGHALRLGDGHQQAVSAIGPGAQRLGRGHASQHLASARGHVDGD